jgi:hypothetical protein
LKFAETLIKLFCFYDAFQFWVLTSEWFGDFSKHILITDNYWGPPSLLLGQCRYFFAPPPQDMALLSSLFHILTSRKAHHSENKWNIHTPPQVQDFEACLEEHSEFGLSLFFCTLG